MLFYFDVAQGQRGPNWNVPGVDTGILYLTI